MIPGWQMAAFERLRIAVVKSAVDDLHKAMRKSNRLGYVCDEQTEMEAWFLSNWGQLLCEDRGQYILDRSKENYKPRSPKARRQFVPEDVQKRMYEDRRNGMKLKEIMQKYKAKPNTVYSIMRRWEN